MYYLQLKLIQISKIFSRDTNSCLPTDAEGKEFLIMTNPFVCVVFCKIGHSFTQTKEFLSHFLAFECHK